MNKVISSSDTCINLYVLKLTYVFTSPESSYSHLVVMAPFTYLLFEGQKVQMDVHPDEIDTVSVRLEDKSIVYAVAGKDEEQKLLELQHFMDIGIAA